jgi:excisionase family DNA binding protein
MLVDTDNLLTIGMAAKRLPVSEPTLRNLIGRHEFPCLRIDGRLFVLETDLRKRFGDEYHSPSA